MCALTPASQRVIWETRIINGHEPTAQSRNRNSCSLGTQEYEEYGELGVSRAGFYAFAVDRKIAKLLLEIKIVV